MITINDRNKRLKSQTILTAIMAYKTKSKKYQTIYIVPSNQKLNLKPCLFFNFLFKMNLDTLVA